MQDKITLGRYIAMTVKAFAAMFYHDVFAIEGFSYLENEADMIVTYRVSGKRKPILNMHLTKLIKDRQMLNCFSREDVGEIGMLYGRLMEKKLQSKKIKELQTELSKTLQAQSNVVNVGEY